jgi:exopolyphosphatase / guanosine-5'-triphosphate,3'-diphosphate pyrophosphatase
MYACIDLGSNSFHLLVARYHEGCGIEIVERFSEKVQLGEGVMRRRRISDAAFTRGIACLGRFREVIDRYPVQSCWALGTNALRVADNAAEFLSAAETIGFKLEVITGEQEAVLVYAGVVSALPDSQQRRLVIDIGGGSTELVVGAGRSPHWGKSLGIGCVSWRDDWFQEPLFSRQAIETRLTQACDAASRIFSSLVPEIGAHQWEVAYVSSGTAKMLSSVCQANDLGDGVITLASLYALRPLIIERTLKGELMPGLAENRRELILPGWAIMIALMETLELQSISLSPTALREGMLAHMQLARENPRQAAAVGLPPVVFIL